MAILGRLFGRVCAGLRAAAKRRHIESELDAEIRFHLEMSIQANVAAGMTPKDARRAALRDLGGVTQTKEAVREVRASVFDSTVQDVRYAVRTLGRSPGLVAAVVLTLAIGIGASTAAFSVVNQLLLQSLPVAASHELLNVYRGRARAGGAFFQLSYPDFQDIVERNKVFGDALAFSYFIAPAVGGKGTGMVLGEAVSASYWSTLGIAPGAGRSFHPTEERADEPVAVISDRFWRMRFGSDPAVLGQTLLVKGRPFTIVGVMPPDFRGLLQPTIVPTDIWLPAGAVQQVGPIPKPASRLLDDREARIFLVRGRLRPGVSLVQAQEAMALLAQDIERQHPSTSSRTRRAFGLARTDSVRVNEAIDRFAVPLGSGVMIGVGLVLLVACVNLANLLLARGTSRSAEVACDSPWAPAGEGSRDSCSPSTSSLRSSEA